MSDDSRSLLYLVRHGAAKPKEEDPDRALTSAGAEEVADMAAWAANAGIRVELDCHCSGTTEAAPRIVKLGVARLRKSH